MARVLVVDDDPDILGLVQARVRQHGHQAVGAASAEEALELVAQRGSPDVAVLDVNMPGMNGFDLLQALRSKDGMEDLPVIFLSAGVQPEEIEAGRTLGATYLTKPFIASALLNAIDRAVVRPESW